MELLQGKEVMQKCAIIYGRSFDPRTWRNWKRTCKVPPSTPQRGDWLTPFEVKKLITLTFLKAQNPRGSYSYPQILLEMNQPDKQDWLQAIAETPVNTLIQPCHGRDLPNTLKKLTGKTVPIDRLYRIGRRTQRKFSRSKQYSAKQINWWLEHIGA
ncbi:hypothetical protein NDA01_26550 [Trichocoleus desertorum AS-A10]|uniref:hypothetical protein n=1 Tax=Trichocoleus desertorum TaxID=1481672 RepID=UPI00329A449F